MNTTEHLLTCLGEEGVEVTKDVSKSLRFGLDDVNVLTPGGPTNRERLIDELNDLLAVVSMLVQRGILPIDWKNGEKQIAKIKRVNAFMEYAKKVGALEEERT